MAHCICEEFGKRIDTHISRPFANIGSLFWKVAYKHAQVIIARSHNSARMQYKK